MKLAIKDCFEGPATLIPGYRNFVLKLKQLFYVFATRQLALFLNSDGETPYNALKQLEKYARLL